MLREGLKPAGVRRGRRLNAQRESLVSVHGADTRPVGSDDGGNTEDRPERASSDAWTLIQCSSGCLQHQLEIDGKTT